MPIRLRQICLVAEQLAPVLDDLAAILDLSVCHVDPGVERFGLENSLLRVGTNFLEVVAPIREGTAAGRYLQRRGGNGGYMVITQVDSLATQDQIKSRVEQLGIRTAFAYTDGNFSCWQMHPADTGATFFEIDHDAEYDLPEGAWSPAGTAWQKGHPGTLVTSILAAEIQAQNPREIANRWSEITTIGLTENAAGDAELALENASVRFVNAIDDRGDGLAAIDISVTDSADIIDRAKRRGVPFTSDTVLICGTHFRLVNA